MTGKPALDTPRDSLLAWIRSWWATLAVLIDRDLRRQLREADRD